MDKALSKLRLVLHFLIGIPVMVAVLFWPAGTLMWIEGWVYLVLQMTFSLWMAAYFLKHNPELIKKRMEMKVPPKIWDRIVMAPFILGMLSLITISGFDYRYGWSNVPIYLEVIGFICFLTSLYWLFLVMNENSYLMKTVEIQKNQKVVSTGPYSIVRHPMYSSVILMSFSIALALGSLYTLIPAAISSILIMIRAYLEDKTLQKELKGYKEYTKKTKYKILPFVW